MHLLTTDEITKTVHSTKKSSNRLIILSILWDTCSKLLFCTLGVQRKSCPIAPGLVDFGIGLMIFVLNLPDGQVLFFGEIQITEGL